jgi:DNA-binding NarL/FixJ family response regulator
MTRRARALVIDDEEVWRDEVKNTLELGGIEADTAATVEEAYRLLNDNLYHVLIVDLRMDDTNVTNEEGMILLEALAQTGYSLSTAIIVLSAYPTMDRVRHAFAKYGVDHFIDKVEFDNEVFADEVRATLANKIPINLDLIIYWQQVAGPKEVVLHLELSPLRYVSAADSPRSPERVMEGTALQARTAIELDDLLCRLFHRATTLIVNPLKAGSSGAGVLRVQPSHASGAARAVIVKYGDTQDIRAEHNNFLEYVGPFIGETTYLFDSRYTPYLGGLQYSLLGTTAETVEDFGTYYSRAELPDILHALEQLFLNTCAPWYSTLGPPAPFDLTQHYMENLEFTYDQLQEGLEKQLRGVQGKQLIQFSALHSDRTFTNPLTSTRGKEYVRVARQCITHGDLHARNIFVDAQQRSWLIDFQRAGRGHCMRDLSQLDSVIRFQLLRRDDATLAERLEMEELLCSVTQYSELFGLSELTPGDNPAIAKAYGAVIYLRMLAERLTRSYPAPDMSDYYIALVYNSLNFLRMYTRSRVQREHALLSASLLVDLLGM